MDPEIVDTDGLLYGHVVSLVVGTPWAVTPEVLAVIQDVLERRTAGDHSSPAEIRARLEAAGPAPRGIGASRAGGVAVLPLHGVISHRASMFSNVSSPGTSVERVRERLRAAVADPNIGTVVLDVDSPGGTVDGIPELASEIYQARASKPVIAVANTLMASAAYWLASQASEIVATPSAEIGSIGVYGVHEDRSKLYEKRGIKTTLISAGKYKVEGHPFAELSAEARDALQGKVDSFYAMFTGDVARGRRMPVDAVRGGMGEGRTVGAAQAVKLGMVDRIATLDETVAKHRKVSPMTVRMDDPMPAPAPSVPPAQTPPAEGRAAARLRRAIAIS